MTIYLQLFLVFFKIGLFGFGGGLAILSIIQNEVISHEWLSVPEFLDVISISQMTPGPISVNCATYVGFTVTQSFFGALIATVALILPGLIALACLNIVLYKIRTTYQTSSSYSNVMSLLRYIVIGLILSAILILANGDTFSDTKSLLIFIGVIGIYLFDFYVKRKKIALPIWTRFLKNPIFLILASGLIGLIIYT